jgi:replicative DNA helicase
MLSEKGFVPTKSKQKSVSQNPPLIPHDLVAEEALLGALLIDPYQMIEVGYLQSKDFFLLNHSHLYQVMADLFNEFGDYDYVTVIDRMEVSGWLAEFGGPGNIGDFMEVTPTSYGAPGYAEIVYRHSVARQVIDKATQAVQEAHQDEPGRTPDRLVTRSLKLLSEIDATRNISDGSQHISRAVGKFMDKLEDVQAGKVMGLKTGINDLDWLFGGFMNKKIYLLAGRPGMGKSGLALQFAHNLAIQNKRVLIFSLEMAAEDLVARLVSQRSQVPYEAFNSGKVDNWQPVIEAAAEVEKLPIIFDDTPAMTVSAMCSVAQKEMIRQPLDLIIIDHAGIVKSTVPVHRKRYEQQSQIADDIMALPKQLGCPVLALLQLSRAVENRANKRPMVADLRDSGKWDENADGIILLYRDEVYNPEAEFTNLAEINVGKNRGGKTGIISVFHDKRTSRFSDLEVRKFSIDY